MKKYSKITILRVLVSIIFSFVFFVGALMLTNKYIPDTGPIELAMLIAGILLFGAGLFTKSIIGSACFFIASIPFWIAATASAVVRHSGFADITDITIIILVVLLVGLLIAGLVKETIKIVKQYTQQTSVNRVVTYASLVFQLAVVTAMVLPFSLNPQYWGQFP